MVSWKGSKRHGKGTVHWPDGKVNTAVQSAALLLAVKSAVTDDEAADGLLRSAAVVLLLLLLLCCCRCCDPAVVLRQTYEGQYMNDVEHGHGVETLKAGEVRVL